MEFRMSKIIAYTIRIMTGGKRGEELAFEINTGMDKAEKVLTKELNTLDINRYKYQCYDFDIIREDLNGSILVVYKLRKELN